MCMEATARDNRSMEVNAARLARASPSSSPTTRAPLRAGHVHVRGSAPVTITATGRRAGGAHPAHAAASWHHAAGLSNPELAEAFNVPLDEVVQRRLELARRGWWQLAPEAVR